MVDVGGHVVLLLLLIGILLFLGLDDAGDNGADLFEVSLVLVEFLAKVGSFAEHDFIAHL